MKTLIIHPKDESTDFLMKAYQGLFFDRITDNKISRGKLRKIISQYDRIVFLGHGYEKGLCGDYQRRTLIDSSFVQLLRTKICVCIWCNANAFVEKYKLNSPLYTGMIISEWEEAFTLSVPCNTKEIEESNAWFATSLHLYLLFDVNMKEIYNFYAKDLHNAVCNFNLENIYQPENHA